MPGSPGHLARRFLDVATSRQLAVNEIDAVRSWLTDAEISLFFEQVAADQRHGYQAALRVVASGNREPRLIRAALLHDIGKRHADLGVLGRVIASLMIIVGFPMTRRQRLYRDHGVLAADELVKAGSDPLIVEFARHHHGDRPPEINPADWVTLTDADEPPKAKAMLGPGITWRRR